MRTKASASRKFSSAWSHLKRKSSARMKPTTFIFMGVCGCGKSLLGEMFARSQGGVFEDADHYHPAANVAKMSAGIPLTDEDRAPWYAILRARILEMRQQTKCYVLACSALKQSYRDLLRGQDPSDPTAFVYLQGTPELIKQRMADLNLPWPRTLAQQLRPEATWDD